MNNHHTFTKPVYILAAFLLLSIFFFSGFVSAPPPPSCSINVTSPNGGEKWGGAHSITWTTANPANCTPSFDILYSTDGGTNYTLLANNQTSPYPWTTSNQSDSTNYRIRIRETGTGPKHVDSGTFTVDNTAPIIDSVADLTTETTSSSGAIITYISPATHDAVDGNDTATCLPASGSTFLFGTSTVTCTKTDAAGNLATLAFTIHVSLIPSSDGTLNLSGLIISNGTQTAEVPNEVLLTNTDNGIEVSLPAGTVVTGGSNWTGILNAPIVKPTPTVAPAPTGFITTISKVIEVGFLDVKLTLGKATRILIPGETKKLVGYVSNDGVFIPIATACAGDTQVTNDLLPAEGDCKIDAGSDLVVWTKHLTEFVTYQITDTTPSTESTGGRGGTFVGVTPAATTPTAPAPTETTTPTAGPTPRFLGGIIGAVIGTLGTGGTAFAVIFVALIVVLAVLAARQSKAKKE